MSWIRSAETTPRATTGPGAAGLASVAAVLAVLAYLSSSVAPSISDLVRGRDGTTAEADGGLPGGATVFDERYPAVANLDPALLQALQAAASEAAGDGVEFHVNSGWRSAQYQARLLREATREYGSEREAARWVAPVHRSAHVSGDAVDLESSDSGTWLSAHGAGYGLCRTYRNEVWHYELHPEAPGRGCPAMYADAAEDPRMRT